MYSCSKLVHNTYACARTVYHSVTELLDVCDLVACNAQTLLDALEAELASLDADTSPKPTAKTASGIPWNFVLLAVLGSLLFAGGAAFSMMLG